MWQGLNVTELGVNRVVSTGHSRACNVFFVPLDKNHENDHYPRADAVFPLSHSFSLSD